MQKLTSPFSLGQQQPLQKQSVNVDDDSQLKVIREDTIRSVALIRYLHKRRIPVSIAQKFCREISYELHGKNYYAIGFKNDAGGYELRNENFKGSSSPKDITFIDNGAKDVAVFEGFFNFLSYRTMYYKQEDPLSNFMILNSTSFFEKSITKMQEHRHINLFLDNVKTGQKFTLLALSIDKVRFKDERKLYQKYDDLNDWLIHLGQSQKQQLRQKVLILIC